MINWNKELVETILYDIKVRNENIISYTEDIYSARADSLERKIDVVLNTAENLDDYLDVILGYLSTENYDDLKELLDI